MPIEWMLSVIGIAVLGILLLLFLWRLYHARPNRRIFISLILALVASQGLFWWDQASFLPELSDFQRNVWETAVFLLALNTILQTIKWVLADLIIRRRKLKFPVFLLDISGWVVMIVVALVTIRQAFGIELTGLIVTSTVASAIIGLSLQDTLGNLFSGISLQIEVPFVLDDWVEIDGIEGQIVSQNWRSLTLLTREDHRVMLTNSNVAKSQIINYSRPTNRQIQTAQITVSANHSPVHVKQLLMQAVHDLDSVTLHQKLKVHVISFQEATTTFGVSYWLSDYSDKVIIRDEVLTRIWFALNRAGVHIPDPTGDFKVKMIPEDVEDMVADENRQRMIAIFSSMLWLNGLDRLQIEQLADHASYDRYTAGETLVRQGDAGDSLFIIAQGVVVVQLTAENGSIVLANELTTGDFFGEMSLLTGEVRSASVKAKEETEVIIIQKDDFANVLTRDPSILERFVDALDNRREEIQRRLKEENAIQQKMSKNSRAAFIKRIRRYLRGQ
ncbi:MAG: mechanosensitive ion channel [Chloroflexi bacterium]|nr:mechanosensitive ion channel [Chloroflexota bacterium]